MCLVLDTLKPVIWVVQFYPWYNLVLSFIVVNDKLYNYDNIYVTKGTAKLTKGNFEPQYTCNIFLNQCRWIQR